MQPKLKPQSPASLDALYALIQEDLKRVDAALLASASQDVPLIESVAQHIIASGGKRIRPAITLIAARLCENQSTRQIGLSAAVELIHTATLLHDDVVDESKLRRGLSTANDVFGNKASVLVGDYLLSRAFQLMVADKSLTALEILSNASAVISQGEVKQLMHEGDLDIRHDDYMQIITSKTAVLFAAASELGAVVADKPELQKALKHYGMNLGIAFQLIDDALDYVADQKMLGKTVGDDFREGKITLPVLLAYRSASEQEKAFWTRTMYEHEQQEGDLAQALSILANHQTIAQTIALAEGYAERAKDALSKFPANAERLAMEELADFCIQRAY